MNDVKRVFRITVVFLVVVCMAGFIRIPTANAKEKSVNEKILEILRERGEITDSKYEEIEKQIKKEQKTTAWLKGFKVKGDLRLRYEGKYDQTADDDDRHRGRFRLRVGFEKKLHPDLKVITRFAGGGESSTSTNQTFDDAFEDKDFWIDRAYAVYKPAFAPGLELGGGKFKNPFVHTDMIWDSDVNPEGVYEKYSYTGWKYFEPFVTLGQMYIYERKHEKDASLLAWQGGFIVKPARHVKWTIACTYYDYNNIDPDLAEDYACRNSLTPDEEHYLYDYHLLNVTNFLDFKIAEIPVRLYFDYVENQDNDVEKDTGYAAGFKLGKVKKKGDWEISYKYASIEPDAVIGAFCDSDFGHANREGHKLGVAYQLLDNVTFKLTGYFIEEESGKEDEYNAVHTDLVFKF